jgi:hypothetical protein
MVQNNRFPGRTSEDRLAANRVGCQALIRSSGPHRFRSRPHRFRSGPHPVRSDSPATHLPTRPRDVTEEVVTGTRTIWFFLARGCHKKIGGGKQKFPHSRFLEPYPLAFLLASKLLVATRLISPHCHGPPRDPTVHGPGTTGKVVGETGKLETPLPETRMSKNGPDQLHLPKLQKVGALVGCPVPLENWNGTGSEEPREKRVLNVSNLGGFRCPKIVQLSCFWGTTQNVQKRPFGMSIGSRLGDLWK